MVWSGCGNSNPSTQGTNPIGASGLKNRAFVANAIETSTGANGGIQIVDAQHDTFTSSIIQGITSAAPRDFTLVPNVPCRNGLTSSSGSSSGSGSTSNPPQTCELGVMFSTNDDKLYVFDATAESSLGNVALPGLIGNFVLSPDSRFAYAAVPQLGEVVTADLSGFSLFPTVSLLGAHYVALSPDGSNLMILSDNSNALTVMNTATRNTYTISGTSPTPATEPSIDHPVAAFFIDDADVAILSCGAECGGTQANVAIVSLTQKAFVTSAAIDAGTVGFYTGGTLYVAGNCVNGTTICHNINNQSVGELTRVDVTSASVSVSPVPTAISGGYHQNITLTPNGEFFIGSVGEPGPGQCANPAAPQTVTNPFPNPGGCLSIVDLAAGQVVIDTPHGDATGATPIPNRTVVYVTEGGQLRIYDSATMQPYSVLQVIPIVGTLTDVKAADSH